LVVITCRIGMLASQGGGMNAVPWRLPELMKQLILPMLILPVRVILLGPALAIGEGVGTTISGAEFVGASGLFGQFMNLILQILILPFSGALGLMAAALLGGAGPLSIAFGLFVLMCVVALRLLKIAEECVLCVMRCQLQTFIVMPFALVMCSFVPLPNDQLWQGGINLFFRSIMRLAVALCVSSLAIIALARIVTTIATIAQSPDIFQALGKLFSCVGGAVIIGSLIGGLTDSLDAAFTGFVGWGAVSPTPTQYAGQVLALIRRGT
jgi:hypothetical protein